MRGQGGSGRLPASLGEAPPHRWGAGRGRLSWAAAQTPTALGTPHTTPHPAHHHTQPYTNTPHHTRHGTSSHLPRLVLRTQETLQPAPLYSRGRHYYVQPQKLYVNKNVERQPGCGGHGQAQPDSSYCRMFSRRPPVTQHHQHSQLPSSQSGQLNNIAVTEAAGKRRSQCEG